MEIALMSIDSGPESQPLAPQEEQAVAHPDQIYFDWIESELKKNPKLSRKGLAVALGVHPSAITRMLKNRERRLLADEIRKVAKYLDAPPPSERSSEPLRNDTQQGDRAESLSLPIVPAGPVRYVTVRGETAAGRWVEYEMLDSYPDVPVVPTGYGHLEQTAYRVRGNSMDKERILDGDFVICVPYFDARVAMTDGDIVVVERRRAGLYERTCKRLEVSRGRAALMPNSTDPRHEGPLFITGVPQQDDETEIEIVGLVVGKYAPIGGRP
jgi:SOS-response transcriptional repressor LexA